MAWTITWLHADGAGGGLDERRRVVRAPGALPGDRIDAEVLQEDARSVTLGPPTLIEPSPDRRDAPCPVSARCGGCDLDALEPGARARSLATMVQRAWDHPTAPTWVASPRATGHRARIKLAVENGAVGYRAKHSHTLVPVDVCGIARPELHPALVTLRQIVAEHPHLPVTAVELRTDGEKVVAAAQSSGKWRAEDMAALAPLGHVAVDGKRVHGDPTLRLSSSAGPLAAGPASFFQVNLEANALLVDHVRARVREARAERALDLYAGIGNLGLPLAADGVPVVAVEIPGSSADDLRRNAAAYPRVKVVALDASRFDPAREAFDVAVLDPPRAGAGDVLDRVLRNRPRRVVLVSCDPLAGARDARRARKAGYRVTDLTCFDLFPDTHHVEVVTVLDR